MKLTITSPSKALVHASPQELNQLKRVLTYTDGSQNHLISRHFQNFRWRKSNPDTWKTHLENLKKDLKKSLVFEENGMPCIRPGSIPYLRGFDLEVENLVKYPKPKPMAWKAPLPFTLHPEQTQSVEGFIREKHANASLCTAFGKSAIILKTCQEMGLSACIVVPGKGIFEESVANFETHFGKRYVGTFGNGKKKLGKKFTICIGDSLANVVKGSPEYEFFSNLDVLIVDESHEFAAESLESVCHGVLANIPYRFFLSATQVRNDGGLILLQSIIGKTVCELSMKEALEKKYVCDHDFCIVTLDSSNPGFKADDPLAQKRVHFLNNKNIASFSARLANAMATNYGKQTLILCEELNQLVMLKALLKVPFALAHSETKPARLADLGLEKVNVNESIEKFNKNEVKVLVTTSCCHTGRNMYPGHNTINWVGGSSEIKTKQASVGRSVRHGRSNPWASKCADKLKVTIYDFDIENNATLKRHLNSRIRCYEESGTQIRYVKLKKS